MIVSIIIVNWNSGELIIRCIESIYRHKPSNYEIIVIDNNSSDKSAEAIEHNFPRIKMIKNSENYGFAKAVNQGIKYAKGDFVLVLNPDTLVLDGTLMKMINFMQSRKDAWLATCKILNETGSIKPSYTAYPSIFHTFIDIAGLTAIFRHLKVFTLLARLPRFMLPLTLQRRKDSDQSFEIPIAYGTVMLMNKNLVSRVGFFSEDYFMYGEDIDLCLKIRNAGGRIYYVGSAGIAHSGGTIDSGVSSRQVAKKMAYRYFESEQILWKKNYRPFKAKIAIISIYLGLKVRNVLHFLLPTEIKKLIPLPSKEKLN